MLSVLSVFSETDKVILDLGGRKRDVLLSCSAALDLAGALEQHTAVADLEPKSLVRGEVWDVFVESFDGMVAMRFTPPYQHVGDPKRVPIPPAAARSIAGLIREKESWARHKMRLNVVHKRA